MDIKNKNMELGAIYQALREMHDTIKKTKKDFNEDAANALRNYIKRFIIYALDVKSLSTKDIPTNVMEKINKKLKKAKFTIKRKKLRSIAVEDGMSAVCFWVVNKKVYFDIFKVALPFVETNDKLSKVFLYKPNEIYKAEKDNTKNQIIYKFETTEGTTIKTKNYGDLNDLDSIELITEKNKYGDDIDNIKYEIMPVAILPNNEDYESTFENLEKIIDAAGQHLNNVDIEWEFDKSMLSLNSLFNPGLSAEDLQKQIMGEELNDDGKKKRVYDNKDPNGMGAVPINFISGGGLSSQVAQRNYKLFKEEALFYALSWLIVSDGKTNKHGVEVITSQLPTFDNIEFQVELLQQFYGEFLFILHNLMVNTGELKVKKIEEFPEVEVAPSKYIELILTMNNKDGVNNAAGLKPKKKEKSKGDK